MVTLSETTLGEEEALAAAEVVRGGWLTQGPRVQRFEEAFAAMVGGVEAVAVANCTVGLELAFEALGVRAGDEVIVPSLTFVATANAVMRCGATPVFADVQSPTDLTLSASDVAKKITAKTKLICPVHYAGFAVDLDALTEAAQGIAMVEDCAHSPGATLGGRGLGSIGAIGAFSFFANKNMTTGEGGMLTTHDPELAQRLRRTRAHGMTTSTLERHRGHAFTYDVERVGTNARMDELRAAIGMIQLQKLSENNIARAQRVGWYRERLGPHARLVIPFGQHTRGESVHHLFVVLLPEGTDRAAVMAHMRAAGVQTSVHYPPTHRFSAYESVRATLPVTDAVAPRLLTLPLHPLLTHEQLLRVCDALESALVAVSTLC